MWQILDADNGKRLESSTGRIGTRDIVQFVPMREVQGQHQLHPHILCYLKQLHLRVDRYVLVCRWPDVRCPISSGGATWPVPDVHARPGHQAAGSGLRLSARLPSSAVRHR
jgi:hypothetical protein